MWLFPWCALSSTASVWCQWNTEHCCQWTQSILETIWDYCELKSNTISMHVTNHISFKWFVYDLEVCPGGKNNPSRLMIHFSQISIYFQNMQALTTSCAVDFILRGIYWAVGVPAHWSAPQCHVCYYHLMAQKSKHFKYYSLAVTLHRGPNTYCI